MPITIIENNIIETLTLQLAEKDARIAALTERAERAEAERDAAIEDLRQVAVFNNSCAFCVDNCRCSMQGPDRKTVKHCWNWRGARKEV